MAARIDALIPWLYLKGVSTGDYSKALHAILGLLAKGLSAGNVVRTKDSRRKAQDAWKSGIWATSAMCIAGWTEVVSKSGCGRIDAACRR